MEQRFTANIRYGERHRSKTCAWGSRAMRMGKNFPISRWTSYIGLPAGEGELAPASTGTSAGFPPRLSTGRRGGLATRSERPCKELNGRYGCTTCCAQSGRCVVSTPCRPLRVDQLSLRQHTIDRGWPQAKPPLPCHSRPARPQEAPAVNAVGNHFLLSVGRRTACDGNFFRGPPQ